MKYRDYWLASLRHYRRIHLSVGCAVAVAAAVLTGAFLTGDSVKGSLRELTRARLGRISEAVVMPRLFRAALAEELARSPRFSGPFAGCQPALLLRGALEAGGGNNARRAAGVSVVGCTPEFGELGEAFPSLPDDRRSVLISQSLAAELEVGEGDEILLRLPRWSATPSDSILGRKDDVTAARRFRIGAVLPADGLSRFSLYPSQQLPRNVFVRLEVLQELIGRPGGANALLIASHSVDRPATAEESAALQKMLAPSLADMGIRVDTLERVPAIQIESDQLVIDDDIVQVVTGLWPAAGVQLGITYLANTIRAGETTIPYSTLTGVTSLPEIGPLLGERGEPLVLADDEIALNDWAAENLHVKVGDLVTITYYQPESTHGELVESPPISLRVRAIVPLRQDGALTFAADRRLTPELAGVTDQASIRDWQMPFELVEEIRQVDEDYWEEFGATPKGFVSLAFARRHWQSRWGAISWLRIPASLEVTSAGIAQRLGGGLRPAELGWVPRSVKRLGLEAAAGTTPFAGLFIGFSFFLITSALLLIVLLFRLGWEGRMREIGILAATGWPPGRLQRMLGTESLWIAVLGAGGGVVLGVAYAWLMIRGLTTIWVDAIVTPFLTLHVTAGSLLSGFLLSVAAAWLATRQSLRQLIARSAWQLLAGPAGGEQAGGPSGRSSRAIWLALAAAVAAVACVAGGTRLEGESQAGAYFGGGAAALTGLLAWRWREFFRQKEWSGHWTWGRLARATAARHPGRSLLTIGLVAVASFLLVSLSAFRLAPTTLGTGGFAVWATSEIPLHYDLDSASGKEEFGFSPKEAEELSGWRFVSARIHDGEDASCRSLYRPVQPRVLGLSRPFRDHARFAWAAVPTDAAETQPWSVLDRELGSDAGGRAVVPIVLDASTAAYSLHLAGVGSQLVIRDEEGHPVTLQVVGLLKNSLLQGDVLMSEENFLRLYPGANGYRLLLAAPRAVNEEAVPAARVTALIGLLETRLRDYGLDGEEARTRLAQFLAIQNTYLSTFQSLGGLGLLLGTVGLAVVQLRSVTERRGELALMRASGIRASQLVGLVARENGWLLVWGLWVGTLSAGIALLPQWWRRDAHVPWLLLAGLLLSIFVVGIGAAVVATRRAVTAPIVPALRGGRQ